MLLKNANAIFENEFKNGRAKFLTVKPLTVKIFIFRQVLLTYTFTAAAVIRLWIKTPKK